MRGIFLLLFLLIGCQLMAQDSRWMYLGATNNGAILLVDTLKDDRQQLKWYNGHDNVVIVWFNIYQKVKTKVTSYIQTRIMHAAIDTTNKQIEDIGYTEYKDNIVVKSNNDHYEWEDVIPDSMGELYLKYAKSLNNTSLRLSLWYESLSHPNPSLTKETKQ